MSTSAYPQPAGAATGRSSRGKDQMPWSDAVWDALDQAVIEEMTRTRVAAKFLPLVEVEKKETIVAADIVNVPGQGVTPTGTPPDLALSSDESNTFRMQEFSVSVLPIGQFPHWLIDTPASDNQHLSSLCDPTGWKSSCSRRRLLLSASSISTDRTRTAKQTTRTSRDVMTPAWRSWHDEESQ